MFRLKDKETGAYLCGGQRFYRYFLSGDIHLAAEIDPERVRVFQSIAMSLMLPNSYIKNFETERNRFKITYSVLCTT